MEIKNNNISIHLIVCNTFFKRLKGFMFKKNIRCALEFPKCNSIHTFFMLKPIDVIMTDKDYKILYIFKNLKPYRVIFPKKNVYYTFELPINKFEFNINEKIKITEK